MNGNGNGDNPDLGPRDLIGPSVLGGQTRADAIGVSAPRVRLDFGAKPPKKAEKPEMLVPRLPLGYLSPELTPWGAEPVFAEGRVILPVGAGATAAVAAASAISAAACAYAEGLTVSALPTAAVVCTYTVPPNMVGIVRSFYARPESIMGYDTGEVTFYLDVSGRRTKLPVRLLGLRGTFQAPIPVQYEARENRVVSILASNASTATWHIVAATFDILLFDRVVYKRHVKASV